MDTLRATWRMAWRNLWRNRRRTLLTGSAIGVGLMALLLMTGLTEGLNRRLLETVTNSWAADGQIHAAGYRAAPDVEIYLSDGDALLARVREVTGVRAASGRVLASAVVAMGDRSAAVQMVGVDFAAERQVTTWSERLIAGRWPAAPDEVLIGHALLETLELEIDGPLILTTAELQTGDPKSARLKVVGTIRVGDPNLDERSAIISLDTARGLLAMGAGLHQVALRVERPAVLEALAGPGLDVAGWAELVPAIDQLLKMQGFSMGLMLLIVGAILGLGILNTLTMALVDRMREFGILRALGTRPGRLRLMIGLEAFNLGLVGAGLGLLLTAPLYLWLSRAGVPMAGVEYGGVAFSDNILLELRLGPALVNAGGVIGITVLAAGWTAWKAGRIQPVEALRRPE